MKTSIATLTHAVILDNAEIIKQNFAGNIYRYLVYDLENVDSAFYDYLTPSEIEAFESNPKDKERLKSEVLDFLKEYDVDIYAFMGEEDNILERLKYSDKLAIFHIGRGGQFYNPGFKSFKMIANSFNPSYFGVNYYYSFKGLDIILQAAGVDQDMLFERGFDVSEAAANWNNSNKQAFDNLRLFDESTEEYLTSSALGDPIVTGESNELLCTVEDLISPAGVLNIDNDFDSYIWGPLYELEEEELTMLLEDSTAVQMYINEVGGPGLLAIILKHFKPSEVATMITYNTLSIDQLLHNNDITECTENDNYDFEYKGKFYTV